MNYQCAKYYTNISTNMNTKIFSTFARFYHKILTFYPPPPQIAIFEHTQLGIIAYIVSYIINYQYAKVNVFIKKLTIDVILCWL